MNEQQKLLSDLAGDLLKALDEVISRRTAHYAVEEVRVALKVLRRTAATIRTVPGDELPVSRRTRLYAAVLDYGDARESGEGSAEKLATVGELIR